MLYYKVCLGSKRYTTEKTDYISAGSAEEACSRAIILNNRMRFAVAKKVELTTDIVNEILSNDGYVSLNGNKIAFYRRDGFVINLANGCSLFISERAKAINAFISSVKKFI